MQTQTYEFDDAPATCPNCNTTKLLAVESLVYEVAHHNDGDHYFKNGGEVLGELRVQCGVCDHLIWTADSLPKPEPADVERWESGNACPSCESPYINEIHVDWKYRTFDGQHVHDSDRTHTICRQCNACGDVLSSTLLEGKGVQTPR